MSLRESCSDVKVATKTSSGGEGTTVTFTCGKGNREPAEVYVADTEVKGSGMNPVQIAKSRFSLRCERCPVKTFPPHKIKLWKP